MSQSNIVSPNIAKGLEEVWQPLRAQTGLLNNTLNVSVSTQKGRDLLNAVKSDFETAYLLKMTKFLQEHAQIPESQVRLIAHRANENLQVIKGWLFNPERPAAATVKAQLKKAVVEMNSTMKTFKQIIHPKPWINQVQMANLDSLSVPWLTSSRQTLKDELQISALEHFTTEALKLKASVPPSELKNFNDTLDGTFKDLSDTFRNMALTSTIAVRFLVQIMEHHVSTALSGMMRFVPPSKEAQNALAAPEITEVTIRDGKAQDAGKKIHIMMREAPIENLVLCGGGGKGRGYLKTMDVMLREHMFDNVKHIAGSSAGALTAVGLGVGLNAAQLEQLTENIAKGLKINVPMLQKERPNAYSHFGGIMPKGGTHEARAAGVVQAIDQVTAESVAAFLNKGKLEARKGEPAFTQEEIARLTVLRQGYDDNVRRISNGTTCRTDPAVTFNDLTLLRRMEGGEQFKNLTLTTWSKSEKKTILLNAETVPHMPLALAARCSMALPHYFSKLTLNLERYAQNPSADKLAAPQRSYVDGGIAMNLPTTVFIPYGDKAGNVEEQQAKTMSFVFDDGGLAAMRQSLKSRQSLPGKIFSFIKNGAMGLTLGEATGFPLFNKNYVYKVLKERERISSLGNVMIVGHGDLGTLSLSPSADQLHIADAVAEAQAMQHVYNTKRQAYCVVVDSPEAAVEQMDRKQMSAFCNRFASLEGNSNDEFSSKVYTLCIQKLGGNVAR